MILNRLPIVKMAGRFGKRRGTVCLHQEWNIDKQKIIDRSFIGKAILEPLDKINMNDKHSTNMLYCKGCIDYVTATCTECGKTNCGIDGSVQADICVTTETTESQTDSSIERCK